MGKRSRPCVREGRPHRATVVSADLKGRVAIVTGAARGIGFATVELDRLVKACQLSDGKIDKVRLNGLIAFVDGVKPRTELEAMIACQLALTHGPCLSP